MSESYPKPETPVEHLLHVLEQGRGQVNLPHPVEGGVPPLVLDFNIPSSVMTHYRLEHAAVYYGLSKTELARLLLDAVAAVAYPACNLSSSEDDEIYCECQEQIAYFKQRLQFLRQSWLSLEGMNVPDQRLKQE